MHANVAMINSLLNQLVRFLDREKQNIIIKNKYSGDCAFYLKYVKITTHVLLVYVFSL